MSDEVRFRTGGPDDALELAELYIAAVHGLAADHYTAKQLEAWAPREPDEARWRVRLAPLRVLVATHTGRAIGFVAWTDEGLVDLLYTHPDSARKGVATRLMVAMEDELRAAGVARLWTMASDLSRPVFASRGFEKTGERLVDVRGAKLRSHSMEKSLGTRPTGEHGA